jgi:GNAT superfamily N-acetyltransferase
MPERSTVESLSRETASNPTAIIADFSLLDNPIWNALLTEHAGLAEGDGLARRYPAAIGPLSGMAEASPAAFEALLALAGPGSIVGLFLQKQLAELPAGWSLLRDGTLDQMILPPSAEMPQKAAPDAEIVRLTSADAPAMVELATLTEPGPFNLRTMELGSFFGIKDASGKLLAMAGERMRWPQFVEVSAVCTHPDARGRGYSRALISRVVEGIRRIGRTPMLHVFAVNPAIRVYESLGFIRRRSLELAVLKNEA